VHVASGLHHRGERHLGADQSGEERSADEQQRGADGAPAALTCLTELTADHQNRHQYEADSDRDGQVGGEPLGWCSAHRFGNDVRLHVRPDEGMRDDAHHEHDGCQEEHGGSRKRPAPPWHHDAPATGSGAFI
jgi:hypothetical protein